MKKKKKKNQMTKSNLDPEKFIANKTGKMCWSNCLKPRIRLADIACMIINWVRTSCSCLKKEFLNNNLKLTWWQLIKNINFI